MSADIVHSDLRQHFKGNGTAKRGFGTAAEADAILATLKPSRHRPGQVYLCPFCKLFHIGHRNRTKTR